MSTREQAERHWEAVDSANEDQANDALWEIHQEPDHECCEDCPYFEEE